MEPTLIEFPIATTKKRSFKNRGATESIQRKRRRTKKHRFADDIIFEILTWLPAKSLMRFKCVSKAWNTLIRDPIFVKSQKARSQTRPSATHLLFQLERHRSSELERLSLQIVHNFDSREFVICSNYCNGLLCLYSHKETQVYFYNISTGERKVLPVSLSCQGGKAPNLFLGFDLATERYKLLHVVGYREQAKIKILTLGTNSWREIHENSASKLQTLGNNMWKEDVHGNHYLKECIFLNGILYWTCLYRLIHYFNFQEESFGFILPPSVSLYRLNKVRTALTGKLAIDCSYPQRGDCCILVYDEVKEDFMICNHNPYLEKVPLLEPKKIGETEYLEMLLATSSITTVTSASASSVFPHKFPLRLVHVSSFIENITPLTFIV